MRFGGSAAAQTTYTLEPKGTVTKGTAVEGYFNGGTTANNNGSELSGNISFSYIADPSIQTAFLTGVTGTEQSEAGNAPPVAAGINSKSVVLCQSVENVMNVTNGLYLPGLSFDFSIKNNSSSFTTGPTIHP